MSKDKFGFTSTVNIFGEIMPTYTPLLQPTTPNQEILTIFQFYEEQSGEAGLRACNTIDNLVL